MSSKGNIAPGGVLPRKRKPNKHRMSRLGIPPLKYPEDVDKQKYREAYKQVRDESLIIDRSS